MASISINGVTYQGDNLVVNGSKIIIDGKIVESQAQGVLEVRILEGVLHNLTSSASVNCGDVMGNVDAGSAVQCQTVGGHVDAGSSVTCGDVGGHVDAGSSVTCRDVKQYVDAGSSVRCNSANSIR